MQGADAYVLSSRWEGLPITLLEAGACGLPAVATDVCGSREIILAGTTGFLVPVGDSASLKNAMVKMMDLLSPERAYMGMDARHRIKERYEFAVIIDQWESLYTKLLSGHPHPRRHGS